MNKISELANISKDAVLGNNVVIKDNVVIEEGVHIGNNVILYDNVVIKKNTFIWDNVVIGRIPMAVSSIKSKTYIEKGITTIGESCVIGCSTVIYIDVNIGNNVLIADNVVIRERTRLIGDNIIGPNSFIQKDCYVDLGSRIIQQSSLASGTIIGKNNFISSNFTCVSDNTFGVNGYSKDKKGPKIGNDNLIGPSVTILDNITIGNNNIIGAKALVTKSIGDNGVFYGIPVKYIKDRDKKELI